MEIPTYIPTKNNCVKRKQHETDAGQNLMFSESVVINPGKNVIDLGIQTEIPRGYFGRVVPRSSAFAKGLLIDGVIDSDYRGNWKLVVWNISQTGYVFEKGESIAQVIVIPFLHCYFSEVERDLNETQRDIGGFGSTDEVKK